MTKYLLKSFFVSAIAALIILAIPLPGQVALGPAFDGSRIVMAAVFFTVLLFGQIILVPMIASLSGSKNTRERYSKDRMDKIQWDLIKSVKEFERKYTFHFFGIFFLLIFAFVMYDSFFRV